MKEVARVIEKRRGRNAVQTVGIFALGAAAGSIIALLFAPASGRVTRRRIGLKLRSMQRSTARQLGQARRILAKKAVYLRDSATEKFSHARDWVAGHVSNGHTVRRQTRQRLHHA